MIRNLFKLLLYPFMGNIRSTPKTAAAGAIAAKKSDNLNVLAGQFASEMEATDYAMGLGKGRSLSTDLGGVAIGPDDVEIIYGVDRISAARPHLHFIGARKIANDANTFFLLSDRGYPTDALDDADVVFLGQCTVS